MTKQEIFNSLNDICDYIENIKNGNNNITYGLAQDIVKLL